MDPEQILLKFKIPKGNYQAEENKNGLINNSYAILNASGVPVYFLQQIDHSIFENVDALMRNITTLYNHFFSNKNAPEYLRLIYTNDHKSYYSSTTNGYWRMYQYEEGQTFFRAKSNKIAAEAGAAYGRFLATLSTIDCAEMATTIEGFHDINLRYDQFKSAMKGANPERLEASKKWMIIIEDHIPSMVKFYNDLLEKSPQRVTHNDTKLSNLLFDENNKARVVVDYDTIMPGYIPLDFGDAVRTICSTTVEDYKIFNEVVFDLDLYNAFYHAFIISLDDILSPEEKKALPMSIAYMPFLMALRMLTDYLNGDIYYSTDYPDHNLIRAGNQLTLFLNGIDLQNKIQIS